MPELVSDLAATTYTFKRDRLILEDKAIVKTRLGRSPDHGDALALTFAYPVMGRAAAEHFALSTLRGQRRPGDFDPLEDPRYRRPGDFNPLAGLGEAWPW